MISKIAISGFRGIPGDLELSLGRITMLTGRNGFGKTTVFDAIDWCLFGGAWRLGAETGSLRNLYQVVPPRVSMVTDTDKGQYVIERSEEGALLDGQWIDDRDLVLKFVRDPDVFGPYAREIESRVRRFVYLPQAEIRELLQPAAESERVAILQGLLGVPNAAVVEKSIRRVQARIAERDDSLVRRLEEVRADIAEVRSELSGVYDHGGLDREAELARARGVLGESATGVESVDGLLSLAVAQRDAARRRRQNLEELRVWLESATDERNRLNAEISRRRQEIAKVEEGIVENESAVRTAAGRRETMLAQLSEARENADQVGRRMDGARRLAARLLVLQEVEGSIASTEAVKTAMEGEVRGLRERLTEIEQSLQSLRERLVNEQRRLETWRMRDARIREVKETKARLSTISRGLTEVRQNKTVAESVVSGLERELLEAKQAKHVADLRYREALIKAPTDERLRSLLKEIEQIIKGGEFSKCPLCGVDHRSKSSLLKQVRETSSVQMRAAEALATVASEVRRLEGVIGRKEAEAAEHRERVAEVAQREKLLVHEMRRFGARLTALGAVDESEDHALEGQTLQSGIENLEREVAGTLALLAELRGKLQSEEAEFGRLNEELAVAGGRKRDIIRELGTRNVDELRSGLSAELRSAESEQQRTLGEVEKTEELVRAAEEELRRRQGATEDARQKLRDLQGRLTADVGRLGGLEREMAARLKDTFGDTGGDRSESIGRLLAELGKQEAELRRVAAAMESLKAVQAQDEARARLVSLQARTAEIQAELQQIGAARDRFDVVRGVVRERADREASDAVAYQTAAIQDCLDALLPHRHLNRVVWDSSGSIFLTDSLLTQAVRPDVYGSTGQLNVLALSVFIGVALLQRVTTLDFIALDEPVQNLDDVHFLAFITLVKRIAASRQIILSTADNNISELFRRQMKSSWDAGEGGYVQYEWRGFDAKNGPDVRKVSAAGARSE